MLFICFFISSSFFSLVHPCDQEDKSVCSQICNKKGIGFECTCEEEYEFAVDGKTCVKGKIVYWKLFSMIKKNEDASFGEEMFYTSATLLRYK